jgi:hypothetical protein
MGFPGGITLVRCVLHRLVYLLLVIIFTYVTFSLSGFSSSLRVPLHYAYLFMKAVLSYSVCYYK